MKTKLSKIFSSIRFKLTLWYSFVLITFCIIFVISLNIIIFNQFSKFPDNRPLPLNLRNRPNFELNQERRELIQSYRENDIVLFRRVSILSLIPLTIFSFLGGYMITGQLLKPLQLLNNRIEEISLNNLNTPIANINNGDEISNLIENFNKMIARLDINFKSQKEFVENASHELKTPLTILKTNLELALYDKNLNNQSLLNIIENSNNSVDTMNKLIEDLLLLAELDNRIATVFTNTNKFLQEIINNQIQHNPNIKIIYKSNLPKSHSININPTVFAIALNNLIDNAIKYSLNNSNININTHLNDNKCIISINNMSEPISSIELSKLFDRFYRIDKSRSRATGGNGLGLAITKKIVTLHDAEITVESNKSNGTTFSIKI
jgi:signal transduction histidine kinase